MLETRRSRRNFVGCAVIFLIYGAIFLGLFLIFGFWPVVQVTAWIVLGTIILGVIVGLIETWINGGTGD